MRQLLGARIAMRPLFGQRSTTRNVHASASVGSDYRSMVRFQACAAMTITAVFILFALPITRRVLLGTGVATTLVSVPMMSAHAEGSGPRGATEEAAAAGMIDVEHRKGKVRYTDEEWRQRLSPEQYRVLRREATERRWTSALNYEKRSGVFTCAGCGAPLFNASTKYESGTGWPSFFQALPDAVTLVSDTSILFMPRTEVRCRSCQGHLGHVFDDGPAPTGLRYCMNGVALAFEPAGGEGSTAA